MSDLLFSLIVPTRGRTENLRRLLDSLHDTAQNPANTEVIAVIDEDDRESRTFAYTGLRFEQVLSPPGQTMGNLNLAGYTASRGRYLMLLNDDVIVRTTGWDAELQRVFERYPDGIVLAHVNDLAFRDTLCIFPFVTREFCELAGGICRPEYRRYCIDDHIHHVFDLIHLLGYTRRIFLPEVIFEHSNVVMHNSGLRQYVPDPAIQDLDHRDFEALIGERRRLALACVERIEGRADGKERAARARFLEKFPNSISLRRREHAIWWPGEQDRVASPPRRPPVSAVAAVARFPLPTRMVFWFWETLAVLAARWPLLAKLGMGVPTALFDPAWYRARYPDVAGRGGNLMVHYLKRGGFEGYNPNPHFDSNFYLISNPDVAASGLNPLVHFVRCGAREGRNPNLRFDMRYYSRQHPDLAAGANLLEHFLTIGHTQDCGTSATRAEYLRRLEAPTAPAARIRVESLAPISVLIPTHNRREMLVRVLEACRQHRAGCELEFVVIDDGSTDGTPEMLRNLASSAPDLRWESQPPAGPGRARNLAATLARHDVLLFLGDDILPANGEFFRTHAVRHAEHAGSDFAVLGKLDWPDSPDFPVNFTMRWIHDDGWQFAFSRLIPGRFASWQFFYTSNLSVKKALVHDWITDGFDIGFPGAALEDIELAYRLWQSQGLWLYYDPGSVGLHYHVYKVGGFLERQYFVGRSLRRMLELHPELVDDYGARGVQAALRKPRRASDEKGLRRATAAIESLKNSVRILETQNQLGTEDWHGNFLSALFELCLHDGYASAWSAQEVNLAAARAVIVERFSSRVQRTIGRPLPPSLNL